MKRLRVAAIVALTSSVLLPSVAHAQTAGFSLDHFEPSERGSDWFVLESLDLRGNLRPAVGVVADYAYEPLVLSNSNGNVVSAIVKDQLFLHAGGSLVLWNRFRASVSVPIMVFADGDGGVAGTTRYLPPAHTATLGDVRLGVDARLFGTYGGVLTGAIGVQVTLPTGNPASYSGDGNVTVTPRALIAGDFHMLTYAAKLGVTYRALDESYAGGAVGTELTFGASAGLRLFDKRLIVGPEIFGHSVLTDGGFFTKQATPLEVLLGAHYAVATDWRVGAGLSTGLTAGFGTPLVRALASVEWAPAYKPRVDRDNDGIEDMYDSCPDVPGVKTRDVTTNGCPSDRDHDGILDTVDACPDVPGVRTDDPKTNGCPPDRDHDGILDTVDACPDVPGIPTNDPKTNGCPDRDHDGILDAVDACPDVAGIKTDDPKTNGCPPDRDHDGIPDAVDACPDQPGKPDPDPKKNGCPQAFVQSGQIVILDQVRFSTGSADILPGKDSEGVLQAVLDVLKTHNEIKALRIEGYTDDRGSARLNKKLSAARAASVVAWLVSHGIPAKSLTSQGFGPEHPIQPNTTDEGRTANRRVEFHIVVVP